MEKEGFGGNDWGIFHHANSHGIKNVWFVECSTAGVQDAVPWSLRDWGYSSCQTECQGLQRICKKCMTRSPSSEYKRWAEEMMQTEGLNSDSIRDKVKRAYKNAEEGINQEIDERLPTKFNLGDNVWDLASNEEQMERKQERYAAKKHIRKKNGHEAKQAWLEPLH
jgi:hypothetical protein